MTVRTAAAQPVDNSSSGSAAATVVGDAETPPAAATVRGSLSPSRAADFKTCPLLYRFRSIDRIPERSTPDQVRGTLVHAVLERLFELPAADRDLPAAHGLIDPEWQRLVEETPELANLFDGPPPADWLTTVRELVASYFTLEDPRRLEPAERECLVEAVLDSGLLLRGFVDRLDVSPAGDLRVVDYKTGGAPREAFEARALFQLKFYALVLWRTRQVVPRVLRLLYLSDREACDYTPDVDELQRFERTLEALWHAIDRATAAQDFRPRPSKLCDWCSHTQICPAFGGTPPPYPVTGPTTPAAATAPDATEGPTEPASA